MPPSRLTSQSHRPGADKPRRNSPSSTQGEAGNRQVRLWDAIRSTRKHIKDWKTQSDHVQSLFNRWILPRERQITDSTCELSEALIDELSTSDHSQAERSLLGLWIIQNLESLCGHPFAIESQWHNVLESFTECLDANNPVDSQLIRVCQQSVSLFKHHSPPNAPTTEDAEKYDQNSFFHDSSENEYEEVDVVFDFGWHKRDENQSASTSGKDSKVNTNEKKSNARKDSPFYEENSCKTQTYE